MLEKIIENCDVCIKHLNSLENTIFKEKYKQNIIELLNIYVECFKLWDNDTQDISHMDIDKYKKILAESFNILLTTYLYSSISDSIKNFVSDFSLISYNWINNVDKDEKILQIIDTVDRIFKQHFMSIELFEMIKLLQKRIIELLEKQDTSVGLSRMYLEILEKDVILE